MKESDPHIGSLLRSPRAMVARSVGIVCIAMGFVVGMEGLSDPDSVWFRTSLGLIATGLVAQAYALYCTVQRARKAHEPTEKEEKPTEDEKNR